MADFEQEGRDQNASNRGPVTGTLLLCRPSAENMAAEVFGASDSFTGTLQGDQDERTTGPSLPNNYTGQVEGKPSEKRATLNPVLFQSRGQGEREKQLGRSREKSKVVFSRWK